MEFPWRQHDRQNPTWIDMIDDGFRPKSMAEFLTSIPTGIQPHEFYPFVNRIHDAVPMRKIDTKRSIIEELFVNGDCINIYACLEVSMSDLFFGYSQDRKTYVIVKTPKPQRYDIDELSIRHYRERFFIGHRNAVDDCQYWPRLFSEGKILHPLDPTTETECGVYEFIFGIPLSLISSKVTKNPAFAAAVIMQIAHALESAHNEGFASRDLKPDDVMIVNPAITGRSFVKIVDANLLWTPDDSLDRRGMPYGTPEYLAPEGFSGRVKDPTVDFYALGCMLYLMLSGCDPFTVNYMHERFYGLEEKHASCNPKPISSPLWPFINWMMSKESNSRPQSGQELRTALKPFVEQSPIVQYMQAAMAA